MQVGTKELHLTAWVVGAFLAIALLFSQWTPAANKAPDFSMVVPGVNKVVITTACDEIIMATAVVLSGPDELLGEVLMFTQSEGGETELKQIIRYILDDLKPKVAFIALEDSTGWQCS
jgi:hypothetical protein